LIIELILLKYLGNIIEHYKYFYFAFVTDQNLNNQNFISKIIAMLLTEKTLKISKYRQHHKISQNTNKTSTQTVADSIVQMLVGLGIHNAFGVGGGAIAPVWEALEQSAIDVLHFRHEAGAAFAAMEAYFANNRPVVVFTTTGPGITNTLTGIAAARSEGAKVILISGCTSAKYQGKWAFQETSTHTLPQEIFTAGSLFHYARCIESSSELPEIAQQLAFGLSKPGGFVAHLSISADIQTSEGSDIFIEKLELQPLIPDEAVINKVAELLCSDSFAIWLGFGARDASEEVLELVERTGVKVMSSPRGKGILSEKHPQFLGVTGFAGHTSVLEYMKFSPPERILVLGTRLGEFTSFWNSAMIPPKGIIHVDIDPLVPGAAYPTVDTFPVIADIKTFLRLLLQKLPQKLSRSSSHPLLRPNPCYCAVQKEDSIFINQANQANQANEASVRPSVLMGKIQHFIVEGSDALVFADAGNCLAWAIHYLKFHQPKRWRGSTGFGSMGYATTGVVGATYVSNSKAVVIVGDGAMLMNNEINTAVHYNIPAVWIVLNDACYNMCAQGTKKQGYTSVKTQIAPTDFVMLARSMGADGICVKTESQIEAALSQAINAKIPFVIDVRIDPTQIAPISTRINSLIAQAAN
jgi:acetolactate synthase I/II/III large subunit